MVIRGLMCGCGMQRHSYQGPPREDDSWPHESSPGGGQLSPGREERPREEAEKDVGVWRSEG
eukprot:2642894-Rhodomonas_salina.2